MGQFPHSVETDFMLDHGKERIAAVMLDLDGSRRDLRTAFPISFMESQPDCENLTDLK